MAVGCSVGSGRAEFKTPARSAFLIDVASGMEIVAKGADDLMPPSSMLKLMTLAMVFDAVKSGKLKPDEMMPVSDNADHRNPVWAPASKICLTRGQKISVDEAIMGLIVMSGGDAGVVAAEYLAGSESAFVAQMQARAREIGMPQSTFGNVSGLPHPNNMMTSRELARLAEYLITNHSQFYPLFATRRFEFTRYETEWCAKWGSLHKISYNKLLFMMNGADGMKTGRTAEGGFGMVASSSIGGRRLIGVINGLKATNHDALAREMKKLLEHGYATTSNRVFFNPGDTVATVPVWYGRKDSVDATVAKTFAVTLPRGKDGAVSTDGVRVTAKYKKPVRAPIRAGDVIGEITAVRDDQIIARAPLIAKADVGRVWFFGRIAKNLGIIFGGKAAKGD